MSSPTLYLGDDLIITGSDIQFNNATVSVKAPVSGLNVVNKDYVDNVGTTLNSAVATETSNRQAEDVAMQALITTLQSENADLSTQLNNLYQYFFNENRDGPVPSRG
jgi:hypothetical protein